MYCEYSAIEKKAKSGKPKAKAMAIPNQASEQSLGVRRDYGPSAKAMI